ncbi:hypothetical protein W03_05160 [Nitrosomonas sp. PY1]|uniref:WD40 repeat domain-containing protein n=1 Tax=Nitrosomonas sp. PY1 TaxID=1803906 RepID=UPI001FC8D238|nr:WD40 repeat domain-containing protein [Nitrosomonas sp. PY1]GKS68512.1 hypothetical protein W03_05160 [Nitrosomonas sp. PY1]
MSDLLQIDAEHPWPWLNAFPEEAAPFFNGRDEESESLLHYVLSAPVTVLFGKSGLGKSSLLQAGLFPLLRKERLLPVYVRLSHEDMAATVSVQIAKHFYEQLNIFLPQASDPLISLSAEHSLWSQLHRLDFDLRDKLGRRWTPVFVLDQFEEIFTLGAKDSERQKQLFYELGDLIENRIPKAIAERLYTDDALYDQLNLDVQHYRFLISLREDYLPDLEEWTDLIPRLGPNRYRLLPMSSSQAENAVIKTGGQLVTQDDARNIVGYLTSKQASTELGLKRRHTQNQVEPALLSLMCSGLNAERLNVNNKQLSTGDLARKGDFIVERFYYQAFYDLPESIRDFVEHNLITLDGVRQSYPERSIEAQQLATKEQIQTLIDRRLIRRESLEEGDRVELVHDLLARVALQHRQDRQQKQETLRRQRLLWLRGVGAFVLILTLSIFAGFMYNAWQKALEAEGKAQQAFRDATAMRLGIEGSAITSGLKPGGTIQGLLKVLAGHRIARSAYTDEVLQKEYRKFYSQIFIRENPIPIRSVAFSSDGARIVSGDFDGTLRLWDAATGQSIGEPFTGHTNGVSSVAFSPDGTRIVSGNVDRTLRLWDAATGQSIGEPFIDHEGAVLSVAFSPDGTRIVSGGSDGTLRLWDAATGQSIGEPFTGHTNGVSSVAFSPDGTRIVSGSWDKTLRLWNAATDQSTGATFTGHTNGVSSVAFSPDGTRIVSGGQDKTLRLWDAATGQSIGEPLTGHEGVVSSVAFSPNGTCIVSGGQDKTLRLWDAATGQSIGEPLTGHTDAVLSVAFSPDGTRIVSGDSDRTLRLWNAATDQSTGAPFTGHTDAVLNVAFSPDGTRIVSGSWDGTLRLWNAATRQSIGESFTGHKDEVSRVAFSPDGTRIVLGSWDGTLRLWDAATGQSIGKPFTGHTNGVSSVVFSPDGTRIVSGDFDGTLRLWDAATGQSIGEPLTGHKYEVSRVAFSPDGTRIVSGSRDRTLRLWNAATGQSIGEPLTGHEGRVSSVAFSPDGTRIVSGSQDRTLRLWDAATGQSIGEPLTGHEGGVFSITFSPDGTRIVSGSQDKTLRLWDAATGKSIGEPLTGHEGGVFSIAFSPNGTRIVSGSQDKTLRLWEVFEGWANSLCKKLDRNMSHEEWQDWVSVDIAYKEQCTGLPIKPDKLEKMH